MEDPRTAEGIGFAVRTAADPSGAVRRWKALSGRKVVGCPRGFPVPELFHSAGMLPLLLEEGEETRSLRPLVDEWFIIHEGLPAGMEEALDRVESVAEWAERVSGEPCREGALDNSIRAYRERDALAARLAGTAAASPGLLDPETLRGVLDAGRFLPVETHAILLGRILGEEGAAGSAEADTGDPFLLLARRVLAGPDKEGRLGISKGDGKP
jgi:hypothetical protein